MTYLQNLKKQLEEADKVIQEASIAAGLRQPNPEPNESTPESLSEPDVSGKPEFEDKLDRLKDRMSEKSVTSEAARPLPNETLWSKIQATLKSLTPENTTADLVQSHLSIADQLDRYATALDPDSSESLEQSGLTLDERVQQLLDVAPGTHPATPLLLRSLASYLRKS